MRIPQRLLRSFAISGLLFSPALLAHSHSSSHSHSSHSHSSHSGSSTSNEISSSHEASVESEADSVMEELGEYTRKKIRLHKLDKLLYCASALIEHQYNGEESALLGLGYMQTAMERINNEDYRYKDLRKECRKNLKARRKGVKKNTVSQRAMTEEESDGYMKEVKARFTANQGLIAIAEKALNGSFECRKASGFDIKVGAILALGLGLDHYTCVSPLGRRYHYAGPTFSAGVGLGVNVDTNIVDPTHFLLPLNNTHTNIRGEHDKAESWALLFGFGKTHDMNKEQKSMDLSIGAGYNNMTRGMFLFRAKRKSDFTSSGLYDHLGLPTDIHL